MIVTRKDTPREIGVLEDKSMLVYLCQQQTNILLLKNKLRLSLNHERGEN
jgi:hypothetical protein